MAVTSIWPVTSRADHVINYARNPEKTTSSSADALSAFHQIDGVMEYAANDMKTEQRQLVTCINCQEDCAAQQFLETKKLFDKKGGRLCYHGYQSFAAGEVDAETAHKIGVELASRLWGDRFEVLVATHCNTGCFHNHFVVNSVSFVDGLKFDNTRRDYLRMRDLSDQLCKAYGLSVVKEPDGRGKHYTEWQAEQEGRPTRRSMIREDIDRAIHASSTMAHFQDIMYRMGYQMKLYKANGEPLKYPGIKPPGGKGYFRFHKLGKGFSLEEIIDRVYNNTFHAIPFPEAERRARLPNVFVPYPKATGLRALYLKYCYELHILIRHPTSTRRVPSSCREDMIKLEKLDSQSRFLALHKIDTLEQLMAYREEVQQEISCVKEQAKKVWKQIHVASPGGELPERVYFSLLGRKAELEKEVRLCNTIYDRAKEVEEHLRMLTEEQQLEQIEQENQRKEEARDEQFRGSSGSGDPNVPEWG